MPLGFTQSVITGSCTNYCYMEPVSGDDFTSANAAWDHHGPSGEERRGFVQAKEAAKEAARQAAKEVSKEAAMSSTSIAKGDVMRCNHAIYCQGTHKYNGASWTHQFGKRKQILCTSCGKRLEASKWVVVAA
jgi:hypothetical protein